MEYLNKSQMLNMIENMIFYEKDFETLYKLLSITDDALFIKIIEEILLGNMFISDFEDVLVGNDYENMLRNTLPAQIKIKDTMKKLVEFRRNILDENTYLPGSQLGINRDSEEYQEAYNYIKNKDIDGMIYEIFRDISDDPELVKASKIRMYNEIFKTDGRFTKEDLFLFNKDYIVSVSYEDQVLNDRDFAFMKDNSLSENEMKKIKSTARFLFAEDNKV